MAVMVSPVGAVADTNPPTVPSGLRATDVSFTWAQFAWNPSTDDSGAVSYYVFEIENTTWSLVSAGTLTGRLGGLDAGRTYRATMRAVDRAGNHSVRTAINFSTLRRTGPAPTQPSSLQVLSNNGRPDTITWHPSDHDGPVYYEVFSGGVSVGTTGTTRVSLRELLDAGTIDIGPNFFTVRAWGEHEHASELSDGLMVIVPNPQG
ncbi:fibronectin type III domain-containing protein [Kribbella sp. NBC_01505]|uniref:fibronectin type III domain-containing protein n=1 Tax=Kribbella sp. NBC_01505 TaxID=2903580 RepID=UPI00386B45F1